MSQTRSSWFLWWLNIVQIFLQHATNCVHSLRKSWKEDKVVGDEPLRPCWLLCCRFTKDHHGADAEWLCHSFELVLALLLWKLLYSQITCPCSQFCLQFAPFGHSIDRDGMCEKLKGARWITPVHLKSSLVVVLQCKKIWNGRGEKKCDPLGVI